MLGIPFRFHIRRLTVEYLSLIITIKMKSSTLTLHKTVAWYESKWWRRLPMVAAHEVLTLAFFPAGRGRREERWEGEGCRGRDGTGSIGALDWGLHGKLNRVLDGQLAGDLHREELDRSVDELLCRGVELGLPPPLPPPWTPTVCRACRSQTWTWAPWGKREDSR
jgi:hypothetical protein